MLDGPGRSEHADRLVAHLPAVAVRAVQEIAAPALAGARDIGQLVRGAGREQHLSCLDGPAAGEPQREAGRRVHHAVFDDLDAVAPDLGARGPEQVGRGRPVARQEPLHVRGGSVARRAGVDDHDPAPRPAEHERRAQTGGPAADDRHVIGFGVHALQRARRRRGSHASLPFPGTAGSVAPWATRRRSRTCWPRSVPA